MKKAAILAFALAFAAAMVHFYYAEDHCPVHCPTRGGQLGHVHDHPSGASICFCFWSALLGPETGEFAGSPDFDGPAAAEDLSLTRARFRAEIAHPPRILSV